MVQLKHSEMTVKSCLALQSDPANLNNSSLSSDKKIKIKVKRNSNSGQGGKSMGLLVGKLLDSDIAYYFVLEVTN